MRGGKPGLGRKGPGAVTLEPHKHAGVYIARGKEHLLVTRNMTPGESVYGEKRVSIATTNPEGADEKVEYRVWNPFRSKLAAGILGGLDDIHVSDLRLERKLRIGWILMTLLRDALDQTGSEGALPGCSIGIFGQPCVRYRWTRRRGVCCRILSSVRSRPHWYGQETYQRHP